MTALAVALSIAFCVLACTTSVVHSKYVGRLTLLDWSLLGMGGTYGIAWGIVVLGTEQGKNPVWENWILPYGQYYGLYTGLALILMGGVCFGWMCGC